MLARVDDALSMDRGTKPLQHVAAGPIDALRMSSRSTHCRSFPGAAQIA
jgi:hypothetical protein